MEVGDRIDTLWKHFNDRILGLFCHKITSFTIPSFAFPDIDWKKLKAQISVFGIETRQALDSWRLQVEA